MMTQQLQVSILAAPLAGMDRRALSQAWYSALRLDRDTAQPPAIRTRGARVTGGIHALPPKSCADRDGARVTTRILPLPCTRSSRLDLFEAQVVRKLAARSTLAQRIECVFADSDPCPKRATFSMGRGRARVHVILQTAANRTTLLALCRPELRTAVGRALAQARLALARRGIGVEVRAVGERACS
jgi:hypothetical protein